MADQWVWKYVIQKEEHGKIFEGELLDNRSRSGGLPVR
jgi:hypothetical protein